MHISLFVTKHSVPCSEQISPLTSCQKTASPLSLTEANSFRSCFSFSVTSWVICFEDDLHWRNIKNGCCSQVVHCSGLPATTASFHVITHALQQQALLKVLMYSLSSCHFCCISFSLSKTYQLIRPITYSGGKEQVANDNFREGGKPTVTPVYTRWINLCGLS